MSAYSCDPTRGSEPGVGWNLVREMARRHRVWAITRRKNEPAIADALQRAPLPNLRMVYLDVPRRLLAFKRGQIGIEIYYRLWQRLARRIVDRLHRDVQLDVTQHVTFVRYWAPTALADVPVPFIWGPVGGGETAPAPFLRDFDRRGRAYEALRHAARRLGEQAPAVRRAARHAALGLAVTEETRARLVALGTRRVEVFSAMGLDRAEYDSLSRMPDERPHRLRFLSMGRLLHWKGFHLGLKAFAAAAVPGAEYWIVGEGPERSTLAALVARLGLADRVRFWGGRPRAEALRLLGAADILVHPSLHDSGGWVCLEAMAARKPVICLDLGGPAALVTDRTGCKVPARHPEQAVEDLARAMELVGRDAERRHAMGEACRERVLAEYIWEQKGDRLDAFYRSVLSDGSGAALAPPA